jgi:hypothetical protein
MVILADAVGAEQPFVPFYDHVIARFLAVLREPRYEISFALGQVGLWSPKTSRASQ